MKEKPDKKDPERQALITRIAQNPLSFLLPNKKEGKTCGECMDFLLQVRDEIQKDSSYRIPSPDPTFAAFVRQNNGTVAHYIAFCTLLKATGFSKIDVQSAMMDRLPITGKKGSIPYDQSQAVKTFLPIFAQAVDQVYGS